MCTCNTSPINFSATTANMNISYNVLYNATTEITNFTNPTVTSFTMAALKTTHQDIAFSKKARMFDFPQIQTSLMAEITYSAATIPNQHNESGICDVRETRTVSVAELVACVVAILTVVENVFVLLAIIKGHRSLRKPPYWFIASLAVADFLTGFEVVLAVFVPIGTSALSRIVLKGLAVVTFIASVNSLLLVAFDRYIRIVHFSEYKRLLNRNCVMALIAIAWIFSVSLFLVAPIFGWSCAQEHCCAFDGMCVCKRSVYGNKVCGSKCSQSFIPFTKAYILTGLAYFTFCVVVMTMLYCSIFRTVQEKSFGGVDCKSKQKREIKLAKTLAITLGIFVVCWLPVQALFVADVVITEHKPQLIKMFDYALVPSVINSFMNPIIYSIRLPRMRSTIERMVFPCCHSSGNNGSIWKSSTSAERTVRRSIRNFSNGIKAPSQTRKIHPARGKLFSNNSDLSSSQSKTLDL